MSNSRTIGWLLSAIALAVVAHLILDMKGAGISQIVRRGTIARSADVANAISLMRPGEPTIVLSKASGEWRLVSPFRASADSRAVMSLLDALAFVPIIDSMDDSELRKIDRRRQDFGLEPPCLAIEVLGPSGLDRISFGNPTPANDGRYAIVEGESVVFVVATNVFAAADKSVASFRSRALFGVGESDVGAFDIKRTTGAFAKFVRDGDKWRMSEPEGVSVSSSRVRKFVSTLLDAQAEGFVWPVGISNETDTASASLLAGYGLDPDSATTLTFKGLDGLDRQVSFGNDTDDGFVYAVVHNGGAVVKVDSTLKDLVLSSVDVFADTRLFPIDESSIASIDIEAGDSQCVLAKDEDGSWRIDAPVSAAADQTEVSELLSRLLALDVADVDDAGVRVSLAKNVSPAKVPVSTVFGDAGFEIFRSKTVVDIEPSQVRRLVVSQMGEKTASVVYDVSRKAWTVESSEIGGAPDSQPLQTLLSTLNPLIALKVVKLKATTSELTGYGLDSPVYTIAIDRLLEDSVRRNIRIGGKADGGRYATAGSSDAVFVLSDDVVRKLSAQIIR